MNNDPEEIAKSPRGPCATDVQSLAVMRLCNCAGAMHYHTQVLCNAIQSCNLFNFDEIA